MDLILPVVEGQGLDLVDVTYKKAGKTWLLQVFIDRPQGINLEDCQNISRQIEDLIEVENLVQSQYTLEVSSPGLDRPLKTEKDFRRSVGKNVTIKTFSPIDGKKIFQGRVQSVDEQAVYLEEGSTVRAMPLKAIAQGKLIIEF